MNVMLVLMLALQEKQDGRRLLPIDIVSKSVVERIPWEDPNAPCWNGAPAATLKLIPQQVQEPMLMTPSIGELRVRSLHTTSWIAFQIEWDDSTNSNTLRSDRFGDGVAVEMPLSMEPMPEYRMGDEGRPVQLALWRAERQRALEEKISFFEENYPYAWCDCYAFEPKCFGYPLTEALQAEQKKYVAAHAAGNPFRIGVAPVVEELSAQTWNRLTGQRSQDARGRGVWADGKWRVVIARPLTTSDPDDVQLDGKRNWAVAFAAWDGGRQNAGPRKMVVEGWLRLKIE